MNDSDFNTPPYLLDLIRKLDKRGIGLDPCSNETSMVDAHMSYNIVTNGLTRSWRGWGLTFMNPPHSMSPNNIEPWIDRIFEEFSSRSIPHHPGDQFVGLVPAKTGPEWAQRVLPFCDARCFLAGRIKFWQNGAPTLGPVKFDSLLLYQGAKAAQFCDIFGGLGWCV